MAKQLIEWLTAEGWEVYQEISLGQGLPALDIAAVRGGYVWAIETKLTLNLSLIGQSFYWKHRAHWSSIAAPRRKMAYSESTLIEHILKERGIGWLQPRKLPEDDFHNQRVDVLLHPRFYRSRFDLRSRICEEHKTYAAAGTNRGGRFSPFMRTCKAVLSEVMAKPGISPKELIAKIEHHYASDSTARTCLIKWAEEGSVKGVRVVRNGPRIGFYPDLA